MQIFGGGDELAKKKDIANPNLAYGYVRLESESTIVGTAKDFTFTADNSNNYYYCAVPINLSLSKGDAITISAFATLSGPQATGGLYKATIYDTNLQGAFEDAEDTVHLKSGIRSSKTIFANRDSNPNDPPVLFIYCGVAGKTGGNTIHVQEVKVERGTVATPWCPAYEDYAAKSDLDALKAKIDQSSFNNVLPYHKNPLTANDDLNNVVENGIYVLQGQTPKNAPVIGGVENWGTIIVWKHDDGQIIQRFFVQDFIYFRWLALVNGTFQPKTEWIKEADARDIENLQNQINQLKK